MAKYETASFELMTFGEITAKCKELEKEGWWFAGMDSNIAGTTPYTGVIFQRKKEKERITEPPEDEIHPHSAEFPDIHDTFCDD